MTARDDGDALRWLRRLCEEGRFVPVDSDCPDGPPDGFDAARFARGQRVAMDNIFSLAYAELVSMLMMFAFEDQTVALLATGKSDTASKAYFRYLSTMRRVRSWYEGDIWEPTSPACKNIKSVRGMHDRVARRFASTASPEGCPSLHARAACPLGLGPADGVVGDLSAVHRDAPTAAAAAAREAFAPSARVDGDGEGASPAWAAADSEQPPVLNQRAMAVTQVAFVGLFILAPASFGAHLVADDDLEALVYVWWVLGRALGVQGRYNLCEGGDGHQVRAATLAEARARARAVVRACVLPRLARASTRWEAMSVALCDGAALAAPGLSLPLVLSALVDVLDVVADTGASARHLAVERLLAPQQRAWRALYRLVLQRAMQFPAGRAFHNAVFRLSLWVSQRVPERLFLDAAPPHPALLQHRLAT